MRGDPQSGDMSWGGAREAGGVLMTAYGSVDDFGAGSRQGKPWWLLVFRGRLWSARRNLSTRSRGKSWLCGLRRENAVWVKRKVIVIWFKKRNCCLGQKESPSCVVWGEKTPSGSKGKSLLYGLKREIVVWVKRKVVVIWFKKRNCCLGQKESPSCVVWGEKPPSGSKGKS